MNDATESSQAQIPMMPQTSVARSQGSKNWHALSLYVSHSDTFYQGCLYAESVYVFFLIAGVESCRNVSLLYNCKCRISFMLPWYNVMHTLILSSINLSCSAIRSHSPAKPVLIFVSSRRQTRLTALDLIAFLATEDDPKQWLHQDEREVRMICITETVLKGKTLPYEPLFVP